MKLLSFFPELFKAAVCCIIFWTAVGDAETTNSTSVTNEQNLKLKAQLDLFQERRPPQQTSVHSAVCHANIVDAPTKSKNAYSEVLTMMTAVVNSGKLKAVPSLATATAADLMTMFEWEFKHMPATHNGPITPHDSMCPDDTDMITTLTNGYIQNVPQRYLLGDEPTDYFSLETNIMAKYMNFPPFKDPTRPTLREANDRILYLANNWQKKHTCFKAFAKLTYVINPIYQDKFFIAPWDSGAYSSTHVTPYGTLDDFWHLVKSHVTVLNYNLADLFLLWYGGVNNFAKTTYLYFEIEMAANAWLPEALLYIVAYFDELWGNADGEKLQLWMRRHKRPIIWGNDDYAGTDLEH